MRDMRDYMAKELHGHDILAVERFQEQTHWMIEFTDLHSLQDVRLYLTDPAYQEALRAQKQHKIKIKRYAHVTEGHIIDFRPKKHCRAQ